MPRFGANFQKYNSRTDCYVLFENGIIAGMQKQKYEGVPVDGESSDELGNVTAVSPKSGCSPGKDSHLSERQKNPSLEKPPTAEKKPAKDENIWSYF